MSHPKSLGIIYVSVSLEAMLFPTNLLRHLPQPSFFGKVVRYIFPDALSKKPHFLVPLIYARTKSNSLQYPPENQHSGTSRQVGR